MTLALALAAGSALLGGGLALFTRRRPGLLERTRTFAFAAAGAVVLFHLLPEVLPRLGLGALVWVGLGFALPGVLEALAHELGPTVLRSRGMAAQRVAAEVGFAALVFHSLVEGLTLWAALQAPGAHGDLEVAIVAHHAPLTAAVVLPFLAYLSPRAAMLRVLGIALAGAAGVVRGSLLPAVSSLPLEQLLLPAMAATAGALLHVAFDEITEQRFASRWERAADLLACAAGLAIAGGSALLHIDDPKQAAFLKEVAQAFVSLTRRVAPALVIGAGLEWLWHRFLSRRRERLLRAVAPDALLLMLGFFSPLLCVVRALLSAVAAVALGEPERPRPSALLARAPWILVGLLAAALLGGFLMPGLDGAQILFWPALILALAAGDPAAATPLAATLWYLGEPAQPITVALALGSAASSSLSAVARRPWGIAITLAAAAAVWLALPSDPSWGYRHRHPVLDAGTDYLTPGALAIWLGLLLAGVWRSGARGFWAPLRPKHETKATA